MEVLTPVALRKELKAAGNKPSWCTGMGLVMSRANLQPLISWAARHGFRNMTCVHMSSLLTVAFIPCQGATPSREADLVKVLCSWQFPAAMDDELAAMAAHRKPRPQRQHMLTEENAEAVDGLMALDEALEVKKATKAIAQKSAKRKKAAFVPAESQPAPTNQPSSSSSSAPAVPSEVRRRIVPEKMYSALEARAFLPPVKGAWIGIHTDAAWQVKYANRPSPPPLPHPDMGCADGSALALRVHVALLALGVAGPPGSHWGALSVSFGRQRHPGSIGGAADRQSIRRASQEF